MVAGGVGKRDDRVGDARQRTNRVPAARSLERQALRLIDRRNYGALTAGDGGTPVRAQIPSGRVVKEGERPHEQFLAATTSTTDQARPVRRRGAALRNNPPRPASRPGLVTRFSDP